MMIPQLLTPELPAPKASGGKTFRMTARQKAETLASTVAWSNVFVCLKESNSERGQ
jgi:hypothetical protein